jgi:hypothetical protein
MTEIQNSKHVHDLQAQHFKPVWVIGYWNLRFVCNLLARRLSGGVLVYCFLHQMQRNNDWDSNNHSAARFDP